MKLQIKGSTVILVAGLVGLMVGLISKFPVLIKSIISLSCVGLILFAMLIETPILGHLNPPSEGQTSF